MIATALAVVTALAALGAATIGGVFLAFSAFVMTALARIAPSAGIAAMQAVNEVILRTVFIPLFFATGAASALVVLAAIARWEDPGAACALAGGILYLAGTLLVTIFVHVPRNERLARLRADDPAAESEWREYVSGWTAWNHVRTAAAVAAAALLVAALLCGR